MKHKVTQELINQVKSLSSSHYIKEISKITGIPIQTVLNIQQNPDNGIQNPKRKFQYNRRPKEKVEDGFFDVDEYAKEFKY